MEQPELMQVKLTLYFENDPVNGVKDGVKELSEVQRIIVDEIRRNPSITTNEMAQKTGVKFRTLQRYISQLQTLGILVREGERSQQLQGDHRTCLGIGQGMMMVGQVITTYKT